MFSRGRAVHPLRAAPNAHPKTDRQNSSLSNLNCHTIPSAKPTRIRVRFAVLSATAQVPILSATGNRCAELAEGPHQLDWAFARGGGHEKVQPPKKGEIMKSKGIAVLAVAVLCFAASAFAQSSGNFSYSTTGNGANPIACTVDKSGTITGGFSCVQQCTIDALGNSTCTAQTGQCMGNAVAGIKTSSGNGNVFVIRPSAVIGLLTDVTVSSKQSTASSSALAGVNFSVSVTGPNTPTVIPNFPITYDSRYIQISTNLFQVLSLQCLAVNGGCFITFNESTVSAHS